MVEMFLSTKKPQVDAGGEGESFCSKLYTL